MKVGQVVYSGKAKNRTQAQEDTYNHFKINGRMECSDGTFCLPGIGWCAICFNEDTIFASSPGLPTVVCPTPFDAVIVRKSTQ